MVSVQMWASLNKLQVYLEDQSKKFFAWIDGLDLPEKFFRIIEARPYLQSLPYWVAATAVGLVAVLYADQFRSFSETSHNVIVGNFPYFMVVLSPICLMLAFGLVDKFSPGAGGSGIPQVSAAINAEVGTPVRVLDRLVGIRVAVTKVFSSLLCVLGGGAIGREGPTIQIAASLFHMMGKWSKRFWPSTTHQPWLIAGGAAGIAAAFNTPLGGIVFAIEELAPEYFSRFKTVLISAVIISGMVAQWMWGPYLFLGFPEIQEIGFAMVPAALFLGAVCGILGGLFGKWLLVGLSYVGGLTRKRRFQFGAMVGVFISIFALLCGPDVMGGGDEVVKRLLFEPDAEASWGLLIGRYVCTILTYLAGAAGGVFAPSLAIGGALGSKFDAILGTGNGNLMILLGMAGFLSAVTRAPFTALVLVFEMTDRHSAIFLLMVASVTAHASSHLIDSRSFYARRVEFFLQQMKSKN